MANPPPDFVQRAKQLIAQRQYQEAAKICRLGLLGQPSRIEGRLVLGAALLALGRFEEVLGEMRVALELDEKSAPGWLLRGEALALKGDYAKAEQALLQALELERKNERASKILAEVRTALAAGLTGAPLDPTVTREYPARRLEGAAAALSGMLPRGDFVDEESSSAMTDRVRLADPDTTRHGLADPHDVAIPDELASAAQRAAKIVTSHGAFVAAKTDIDATTLLEEGTTSEVTMPPMRAQDQLDVRDEPTVDVGELLRARPVEEEDATRRAVLRDRPPPEDEDDPVADENMFDLPRSATTITAPLVVPSVKTEPQLDPEESTMSLSTSEVIKTVEERRSAAVAQAAAEWDEEIETNVADKRAQRTLDTDEAAIVGEVAAVLQREPVAEPTPATPPTSPLAPRSPIAPLSPTVAQILGGGDDDEEGAQSTVPLPKHDNVGDLDEELIEDADSLDEVASLDEDDLEEVESSEPGVVGGTNPESPRGRRSGGKNPSLPSVAAVQPVQRLATPQPAPVPTARPTPVAAHPPAPSARPSPTPAAVPAATARPAAQPQRRPLETPQIETPTPDPIATAALQAALAPPRADPTVPLPPAAAPSPAMLKGREPTQPSRRETAEIRPAQMAQILRSGTASVRGKNERFVDGPPSVTDLVDGAPRGKTDERPATRWPRSRVGVLVAGALLVLAVVVVAGITGAVLREWRVRGRVARRLEAAHGYLASGTYAGYQAAVEEYRRILVDRPTNDEVRAARARTLALMTVEFGEPVESAAKVVSALGDDDSEDAVLARGYVALGRGDLSRARRVADDAEHRFADAASYVLAGRVSLAQGHPDEAARALRTAVTRDATDPVAYHALGLAESRSHQDDAAKVAFDHALAIAPHQAGTIVDRADLDFRRKRNTPVVLTQLERVVTELEPEASPCELARAYLVLARVRLGQGNIKLGRELLAHAASKRPEDNADLSLALGDAYLEVADLDAAEAEARRTLGSGQGSSAAYLLLAQAALARNHPREALSQIARADGSQPESMLVHGLALLALGDTRTAKNELDAAIRLEPEEVDLRAARARVDIAEGNALAAERDMERLEKDNRGSYQTAESLAVALKALRQPDRARYWFKRALERMPQAIDPALELARLDRADGRVVEAREGLKKLIEAHPEQTAARQELASLDFSTGALTDAARDYDAILAQHADDLDALLGAARAHLAIGDVTVASERLASAEKLGATGEELADLKAKIWLRDGKADQVLDLLRPIIPRAKSAETVALLMIANDAASKPIAPRLVERLVPPTLRRAPEVLVAQARTLEDRGKWVPAQALLNPLVTHGRAAKLIPSVRAEVYATIGRALRGQGQVGKAARWLDDALKQDPHNAHAALEMALVLDLENRHDLALTFAERSVQSDPSIADGQYELGRLRAVAHDPKAKECFEAYLKLAPSGAFADDARRALGQPVANPPAATTAPQRSAPAPSKHRRRRGR